MTADAERLLERDRIHQLLVNALPDLKGHIEVDDANPMLSIPSAHAGAIVLWKSEHEGVIRWRMAAPDGNGVTGAGAKLDRGFPGDGDGQAGASA